MSKGKGRRATQKAGDPAAGIRTLGINYDDRYFEIPVSMGYLIQLKKILGADFLDTVKAGKVDEETAIGFICAALRTLGGEFADLDVQTCANHIPMEEGPRIMAEFAASLQVDAAASGDQGNAQTEKTGPGEASNGSLTVSSGSNQVSSTK